MPQSHQNAWPFMEPVKKTDAPGYYQVIRFPMGAYTSTQGLGLKALTQRINITNMQNIWNKTLHIGHRDTGVEILTGHI